MGESDWDGQQCLGKYLGLAAISPAVASGASTPGALAACPAGPPILIRPERLGAFLRVHRESMLICQDAGALHWSIADHLRGVGDDERLEVHWGFSKTCRLADVVLLDQLVARAEGRSAKPQPSLRDLAHYWGNQAGGDLEGREQVRELLANGGFEPVGESPEFAALSTSRAVRAIFKIAIQRAREIIGDLKIPSETVARYGPLSLGVQVQGVIAVALARRNGLRLSLGKTPDLREEAKNLWVTSSKRLRRDLEIADFFVWDGEVIKEDKAHLPSYRQSRLKSWLGRLAGQPPHLHHPGFDSPRKKDDSISTNPDDWGHQVLYQADLSAWAELWTAASMGKTLDAMKESPADHIVRPRYEVLPRLRSSAPDLCGYRRHFETAAFEAGPDHVLVVGKLDDLLLRCHAELCERGGGESQLGGLFRSTAYWRPHLPKELDGVVRTDSSPAAFLAWHLYVRESEADEQSSMMGLERFYEVYAGHPAEIDRWIILARALLRLVPLGLGASHVRSLLAGNLDITADEAERYVGWFSDILPEMGWLNDVDDTFEIVMGKFGCKNEDLEFIMLEHHEESAMAALRNLISGRTKSPAAFARMREVCRDESWKQKLEVGEGSDDLFRELFSRCAISPVGRARRGIFLSEGQMAAQVDFAEDVMKVVLYGLAAWGFELAAFTGEEFAVRCKRPGGGADDLVEEIRSVVDAAAAGLFLVNDFAPRCRVEIRDSW